MRVEKRDAPKKKQAMLFFFKKRNGLTFYFICQDLNEKIDITPVPALKGVE